MAKTKGQYTHLKQAEFKKIRSLLDLGLTNKQTMELSGRSSATVSYIKRSKDFEEYMDIVRQAITRQKAKKEAATTEQEAAVEVIEAPVVHTSEVNELPNDELVQVLSRIADGVERLVKAWETQPKKKSLF